MPTAAAARFAVGRVRFAVVSDGTYYYDAGAVFGVVPRALWEPLVPPLDREHRLPLGLNCLLLHSDGKTILVESGVGGKRGDRDRASPAADGTLLDSLAALGVQPHDVDIVINTHLHADHCGWNTTDEGGALRPTFPNARYLVSRTEWEDATHPNVRTRATYLERNLAPLVDHLELFEDEHCVTSEVALAPAPGHTAGHASVVIRSGREWGVYLGDLAQHRVQLERPAWVGALDLLPLVSIATKERLLGQCVEDGALIVMCHAPYPGVMRIRLTERGRRESVAIQPLDPREG